MRTETHWKVSAFTDALTQLPNRRWFMKEVSSKLAISTGIENYALLIIDADHFKAVNDRHGHAAGDAALMFIADALRATTQDSDRICRLGGEEFAVFMSAGVHRAANRIAESLRGKISRANFNFNGTEIPLTISIGVVLQHGSL